MSEENNISSFEQTEKKFIQANKIDESGFYIEPVIIEYSNNEELNNLESNLILEPIKDGFFLPKWNGTVWVEGENSQIVIDYRRTRKETELKEECERAIIKGFKSQSTGHFFAFDNYDQNNFTQQMVMLLNDPAINSVIWKTENAGTVTLTKEEFIAVVKESENHKRNNIGKLWQLRSQLASATTIEEIEAIQWNNENTIV